MRYKHQAYSKFLAWGRGSKDVVVLFAGLEVKVLTACELFDIGASLGDKQITLDYVSTYVLYWDGIYSRLCLRRFYVIMPSG